MVLPDLLHANETQEWGDQAYRGQRAVIRESAFRLIKESVSDLCAPDQCQFIDVTL